MSVSKTLDKYFIIFLHNNLFSADFNAIYIGPKSGKDKTVPLIVMPHGGPHSVFGNYLFLEETMYLSHGRYNLSTEIPALKFFSNI